MLGTNFESYLPKRAEYFTGGAKAAKAPTYEDARPFGEERQATRRKTRSGVRRSE